MNDFEMTLHNPMTHEDWAKITDANMEHTQSVTFQTEGGKKVEFVKVVRCKDCKHYKVSGGQCPAAETGDPRYDWTPAPNWYCADGERKDT